jgi:type II secretory pathway pseudopilin PulG
MNPFKQICFARRTRGYTLVELLLVMGIIIMVITLVLISVNSMLKSSRMARAVSLITTGVDESRTSAITVRRATRLDVTPMDQDGKDNVLTVSGMGASDNFEQYRLPDSVAGAADPTQDPALVAGWKTTGGKQPLLVADGSRCLKIRGLKSSASYWYRGNGSESINTSDYYEAVLFARIKILPGTQRKDGQTMTVGLLGAIDDGGSRSIRSSYRLSMRIVPSTATGRNDTSSVQLERFSGSGAVLSKSGTGDGEPQVAFDQKSGAAAPTSLLVEGIWYRTLLSVKYYLPVGDDNQPRTIVAGKIWADGQLEPLKYTVGPVTDKAAPLSSGYGGFTVDGCDAVVDDFLYDMRPVRLLPQGVTITPLDPTDNYNAAKQNSKYSFPLMFRPDGTTSVFSILEIADSATGDRRYVRIDQNTGRARVRATLDEVKK